MTVAMKQEVAEIHTRGPKRGSFQHVAKSCGPGKPSYREPGVAERIGGSTTLTSR